MSDKTHYSVPFSSTSPLTSSVSILVLTRNESLHIERCLCSAFRLSENVYVLDSKSSDATATLAKNLGATVISGDFNGFAQKLNWGLDNIVFPTPWVLRLDADEIFSEALVANLPRLLGEAENDVSGIYLRRQLWFMGKWMRHGDVYPTYSMRLWRRGGVVCEARELDEHMILRSGRAIRHELDIIDDPLFTLATWIEKHNGYSTLEADSAKKARSDDSQFMKPSLFGTSPQRRRWLKVKFFYRLPPFARPILYFFYRYVIRMGFLDGRIGFIFHFMHGLWYRCLVDAKMLEKSRDRSLAGRDAP